MPEAYELLLSDALHGDSTFFVPWKEVELSWKWAEPILDAFEINLPLIYIRQVPWVQKHLNN